MSNKNKSDTDTNTHPDKHNDRDKDWERLLALEKSGVHCEAILEKNAYKNSELIDSCIYSLLKRISPLFSKYL